MKKTSTCVGTCVHKMTVLTGHLKILRGCRIHNDNNYTNDVNRGLLNSLSIFNYFSMEGDVFKS